MKRAFFVLLVMGSVLTFAQTANAPVVGTWEGESVCQVPKPCTTEHVIYEIRQDATGQITMKADKVVNGERQWMGTLNCLWFPPKLSCPMTNVSKPGDWTFWLDKDTLRGTLTIREGNVLYRKIMVKRK